ncbi:Hermansky-Pudlak syndrome 5 protein-like protein [Harpegnathos saltator]|uniref:Hermansky-Pudlak syndrome 5 protein-like protein n=1 Tax=Harpegnathos saltator TaxID=610380 RepID=E2BX81_HARSA|nr:Hermansky-Pudlak syndrome 5 protein-like protein [Harpegnathos saltator]
MYKERFCLYIVILVFKFQEGAVSHVTISPDEKTIVLTTTRDTVCLVSLKPTPRLIAVLTEHMYKQITCLCWNKNSTEVYIGDAVGRISVMVLSIFTVNGMFQTRVYTLMNLDSSVVQLSFCSSLLLVSTLTRCYICDTVREQYKQIGNKARNGEFGACFYEAHTNESGITPDDETTEAGNIGKSRGAFNLISDNDSNISCENCLKIFCARPGSRLWEVSADGVVVKTHQLKEALAVPPTAIYRPAADSASSQQVEEKEQAERTERREWLAQSVNFSRLFVIARKYLLSHTSNSLYVIDPASANVLLWSNEFASISMTAVADDKIYLMTGDGEFHCLTLSSLSALLLRLYRHEEYRECLRACDLYRDYLSKTTAKREMVELLELDNLPRRRTADTSREKEEEETLTLTLRLRLRPLITLLRSNGSGDRRLTPVKLDSGIVVVHPENDRLAADRNIGQRCETTFATASRSSETSSEESSAMQTPETTASELDENVAQGATDSDYDDAETLDCQRSDPRGNTTHRVQSDLESVYTLASSIRIDLSERDVEEIVSSIDRRMRAIGESYKDSPGLEAFLYEVTRAAELHCHNSFLENTSVQLLRTTGSEHIVRQFVRAFTDVNASSYGRCGCGYPSPMEQSAAEPKFLAVGQSLIARFANDKAEECGYICDKVPYMWREYLAARVERRDILDDVLRQCLQTRDNVVLSLLLPALNEQQWSCVDACISEMENGTCLFCATPLAKKPDRARSLDWSGIARGVMEREGPDKAVTFLFKLQNMMPDITLDKTY